jgi:hypothetical protein
VVKISVEKRRGDVIHRAPPDVNSDVRKSPGPRIALTPKFLKRNGKHRGD